PLTTAPLTPSSGNIEYRRLPPSLEFIPHPGRYGCGEWDREWNPNGGLHCDTWTVNADVAPRRHLQSAFIHCYGGAESVYQLMYVATADLYAPMGDRRPDVTLADPPLHHLVRKAPECFGRLSHAELVGYFGDVVRLGRSGHGLRSRHTSERGQFAYIA